MKIKHFAIFMIAAAAALFTSCVEKEWGEPAIKLDKTELAFDKDGGEQTVTLTTTRDWKAKDLPEWVVLTPESGTLTQKDWPEAKVTVTVKVAKNDGFNRKGEIEFSGGIVSETLAITQEGPDGEDDGKITVADFIAKADTQTEYILTGKISNVTNSSYRGFDLTDATGTIPIAFPTNFDDYADKLEEDGMVEVKGKYNFYSAKQTHQMEDGFILSYTAPAPIDPSTLQLLTVQEFIAKADPGTNYKLSGTVTKFNSTYSSFDLQDATGSINIYSLAPKSKTEYAGKLANGGKVTLYGKYYLYNNSKVEILNAVIVSYEAGAPVEIVDITCADFLKLSDNDGKNYRLKGKVTGSINTQYGNFDVEDNTGKVYVYGCTNIAEWKDKLVSGATISIYGPKTTFTNTSTGESKVEMLNGTIESIEGGTPGPGPDAPTEFTKATVAEFLAAPVAADKWYELTGAITSIAKAEYGNIYVKDATGEVYVYGLTKTYVTSNDKSFSSIGLKVGDTVTFRTLRNEHEGQPEAGGTQPAFYVSHIPGTGTTTGGDITATHPFTSNVTWTAGTNGYDDQQVVINGTSYKAFKLGKSSAGGTVTVKVPAGTTKLNFYALGWSNKAGVIKVTGGGVTEATVTAATNTGIQNNSPFTITKLADTDYYTVSFASATTAEASVDFTTTSDGVRAVVFGVNAQ
ncbi:MAG: hypothetical protein J5699_01420 [Bacteroidales bacterium]|nr:hypothetical protein [Bacteroidales bacterium]